MLPGLPVVLRQLPAGPAPQRPRPVLVRAGRARRPAQLPLPGGLQRPQHGARGAGAVLARQEEQPPIGGRLSQRPAPRAEAGLRVTASRGSAPSRAAPPMTSP